MSNTVSVEDVPLNRFHRLLTIRSGGGSFVDGYVLSIIGIAMMKISPALGLTAFWEGLIAASALIGIFFGGFIGGALTDRLGRRMLYFVGPTLFVICSVAQYWVQSGEMLFALRFLNGVAVGIEYPVATAFLVEFLPKKNRGPCLATLTILWFAGAAAAYMIGEALLHFGGPDAWRLTLASTAVIGALLFLVRMGTPESPRWLMSKGRHAEAEAIIRRVYGPDFGLDNLPEQAESKNFSFSNLLHSGVWPGLWPGQSAGAGGKQKLLLLQPAALGLWQTHGVRHHLLDLLGDPGLRGICLCPESAGCAPPEREVGVVRFGSHHPAVRGRLHYRYAPGEYPGTPQAAAAKLPLVGAGAAAARSAA